MTSTTKHLLILSIFTLVLLSCGQSDTNNKPKPNESIKSTKEDMHEQKHDFFSTDLEYNVNGISVLDTFELEKYIEVLGQPDSIKRGGTAIIEEFGHDDYDLWYGKNWINAGHGYILTAEIKDVGISFNRIQVGDHQVKIENTFTIPHSKSDTIKIINKNDVVLTFYLRNKIINTISLGRSL